MAKFSIKHKDGSTGEVTIPEPEKVVEEVVVEEVVEDEKIDPLKDFPIPEVVEDEKIEHMEIPEDVIKAEEKIIVKVAPSTITTKSVKIVASTCTEAESKIWNLFHKVTVTNDVTRILLYGKPGTGKTTQACKSGNNGFYTITLTEESSVSEILGMWIPKGNSFEWFNGIGIRAWIEGKVLVLNEIDHAPGSIVTICHALLDDKEIAAMTLPNGETVKPSIGFKAIATMNGGLSDLPLPLLDRFEIKLDITEPHPLAIKSLEPDLQELVKSAYSNKKLNITFREIVSFGKLRKIIGDDAFCVFGSLANDVKTALKLGKREIT